MSSGFITEQEVAERRKVRQENWEKNRTEDDPEEAPEEPVPDHRSLYDRLQEQRQKKQEEYDEAHKFKNMVRGLEDDEVDFLEQVDRSKLQEEVRVRTEETAALAEYRKKVSAMNKNQAEEELRAEIKAGETRRTGGASVGGSGSKKQPSHLSLLAGAIKRKSSEDEESSQAKKEKTESGPAGTEKKEQAGSTSEGDKNTPSQVSPPQIPKSGLQCIAVLPGLGVYTDSSDSDNNGDTDSDSDDEPTRRPQTTTQHARDITGRIVKTVTVTQCSGGQGGC